MTTKQNLAVVIGTYSSNGEDKNRYMNCGVIVTKDDGGKFMELNPFINYAALPRKDGKLYLSVFDDDKAKAGTTASVAATPKDPTKEKAFDDEIPF